MASASRCYLLHGEGARVDAACQTSTTQPRHANSRARREGLRRHNAREDRVDVPLVLKGSSRTCRTASAYRYHCVWLPDLHPVSDVLSKVLGQDHPALTVPVHAVRNRRGKNEVLILPLSVLQAPRIPKIIVLGKVIISDATPTAGHICW